VLAFEVDLASALAEGEFWIADRRRGAFIHYADLATLMVMLDMNPGGGVMDAVNEAQKFVRPRASRPNLKFRNSA